MIDLIYKVLSDSAPVTDVVEDRIYPEYRAPGSNVPSVVIDLVGVSPLHTMKSRVKADKVEMDVTCFSNGIGSVISLSRDVRQALEDIEGMYVMQDGTTYNVADSKVYAYSTNTDYDGRICAAEVSVSFSIKY